MLSKESLDACEELQTTALSDRRWRGWRSQRPRVGVQTKVRHRFELPPRFHLVADAQVHLDVVLEDGVRGIHGAGNAGPSHSALGTPAFVVGVDQATIAAASCAVRAAIHVVAAELQLPHARQVAEAPLALHPEHAAGVYLRQGLASNSNITADGQRDIVAILHLLLRVREL